MIENASAVSSAPTESYHSYFIHISIILKTSNKMKVNIFMMTALALILTIGSASCNEKEGKGETPAGMHEVTYQGFAFLCPDVLKPAKKLDGGETVPNIFMLEEMDISNTLMCEVSDTDAEFTPETGELFAKEMQSQNPNVKVECKVLKDGLLVKTVSNDPSFSSETIYTAMRMFFKGKKMITVTLMYSEKNKATLSKYADAVMNSVRAIE